MTLAEGKYLCQLAVGFRKFARSPVGYEQALGLIKNRLAHREERFLEAARRLIYDSLSSPYRQLLLWAGCQYGDLAHSTQSEGIERTLERLRDAGVYLTLEEFKSRIPINRRGLTIETREIDFDNPRRMGARIVGHTSGSSGANTRVGYDWQFIEEEAANELILYAMHGVDEAPMALWYPAPPGVAGIHNLLMNIGWGRAPEKWFSQTPPGGLEAPQARLGLRFLSWAGRAHGVRLPWPEFAETTCADQVVRWMIEALRRRGASVVRTYASSAVRVAEAALAMGEDLSGAVIFAGGEPLTERRRRFIESTGVQVFPRYVVTETGLVAATCPNRGAADDMHLYTDRIAAVLASEESSGFLFTTLSIHTAKVVFNAGLGDFGALTIRPCDCLFGELGFGTHLSEVRSLDKVTIEGMTMLTSELDAIIGSAVADAGGNPDSYQFRETQSADGLNLLIIAVSPDLKRLDEPRLIASILERLDRRGPRTALASRLWHDAGSLRVVRERPSLTEGQKMPRAFRGSIHPPALRS